MPSSPDRDRRPPVRLRGLLPRRGRPRPTRVGVVVVVTALALVAGGTTACSPATARATAAPTALQRWLAQGTLDIAHRGGSADWPEASPLAYRSAAAWNPDLALEFPARRTADGVWVGSEDATTGRVFGRDLSIAASTWAQLSTLRSTVGGQPMSRLQQTVLAQVPTDRILFVDDKDDAHAADLLDLLDHYGGRNRTVIKAFHTATVMPAAAKARGYTTWGYWYADQMADFATEQGKFTMLGMRYDAPASVFSTMRATGKRVIAHIVATDDQADLGLSKGATGLMVSGVTEVVPHG